MTSTEPADGGRTAPRPTRQRRAVAQVMTTFADFRSAQEIHELLEQQGEPVGLATVYRTLQLMADHDEVDVLRSEDGEAIYRRCSDTHHHHLVCASCGVVRDVIVFFGCWFVVVVRWSCENRCWSCLPRERGVAGRGEED